ncbi:MAG: YraN family protein [Christensenellales bacterium]
MNTKISGRKGEDAAAEFLKKKRYKILCRNYAAAGGEIDIIARDKNFLVFVEVKYRRNLLFEIPSEAVDLRKRRKIVRTAKMYLAVNRLTTLPCRFDIVEVVGEGDKPAINHIENAFEDE